MINPSDKTASVYELDLGKSDSKADFLYKHAPVGIWEEDWSEVKRLFNTLSEYDQLHFEEFLKQDRSHVEMFKRATRVISVNPAALKEYGFKEDEHDQFIKEYDTYIADFMPDLVTFAQGKYVSTSISEEVDRFGNQLVFRDVYCIPDNYRESWQRVICISQEVSDVLRHERIADEQLRHLEMAAKIAKIGYWTSAFGDNAHVYFSGAYLNVMDMDENQEYVNQQQINDAIHPDDKQRVLATFEKADRTLENYSVEYRIITPKGSIKHLREIGEIIRNDKNQPFSHHGIIQDISHEVEQKQKLASADKAVRQLEDQFMGAINALKVGIALFNKNHELIKANNYFNLYFKEFDIEISQHNQSIYDAILKIISNTNRKKESQEKAQQWQQWFDSNSSSSFEYFDGFNWFTLYKEPQKDGTYIITLSDISDIKDRERELQQKQQELELLATKDALTGIHNRRKFNESLNHEFRRCMRNREPLSLIICDIDWFKKYNDHYGHLKGDDCLRLVASAINSCFSRATDIVARYGGEEFAVILPNTDQQLALILAQKVCNSLRNQAITHEESLHDKILTLSVGVATMTNCFESNQIALIDAADNALYEAKEQGRNCVKGALC